MHIFTGVTDDTVPSHGKIDDVKDPCANSSKRKGIKDATSNV